MGRNDLCFCGSGKKQKKCHPNINEDSVAAKIIKLYTQLPFQKSVLNVQFQSKPVYYTYLYNFYSFSTLPN